MWNFITIISCIQCHNDQSSRVSNSVSWQQPIVLFLNVTTYSGSLKKHILFLKIKPTYYQISCFIYSYACKCQRSCACVSFIVCIYQIGGQLLFSNLSLKSGCRAQSTFVMSRFCYHTFLQRKQTANCTKDLHRKTQRHPARALYQI